MHHLKEAMMPATNEDPIVMVITAILLAAFVLWAALRPTKKSIFHKHKRAATGSDQPCPHCRQLAGFHWTHETVQGWADLRYKHNPLVCNACGRRKDQPHG